VPHGQAGQFLGISKKELRLELKGNVVVFVNDKLALREEVHSLEIRINGPVRYSNSYDCCSVINDAKSALVIMEHEKESNDYRVKVWLQPTEIENMERNTVAMIMSIEGIEWLHDFEKEKCSQCNQVVKLAIGNDNTINIYLFTKDGFVTIETPKEKWERGIHAFIINLPGFYDLLEYKESLVQRIPQILRVPRGFRDTQLLQQVSP
jgi:hypothetical protein